MRTRIALVLSLTLLPTLPIPAIGANCNEIRDGVVLTPEGGLVEQGFDWFGYNYGSHKFNGDFCDYTRGMVQLADCSIPDKLKMSWDESLLSNKDCDGDLMLDRYPGFAAFRESGAWITNSRFGRYHDSEGRWCRWTYQVSIAAAPQNLQPGLLGAVAVWIEPSSGSVVGPAVWSDFLVLDEKFVDRCGESGKTVEMLRYQVARPDIGF